MVSSIIPCTLQELRTDISELACTTLGLPMDIFDFDISPSGAAKKLDMGSCAFETGITEGEVTKGGKNSEHSFGGGLTFKK